MRNNIIFYCKLIAIYALTIFTLIGINLLNNIVRDITARTYRVIGMIAMDTFTYMVIGVIILIYIYSFNKTILTQKVTKPHIWNIISGIIIIMMFAYPYQYLVYLPGLKATIRASYTLVIIGTMQVGVGIITRKWKLFC